MSELRYTDTNAGNDSKGRVFGLEGNLYLPVLLAVLGALALFALLSLVLHINAVIAVLLASIPLTGVLLWILILKQGRPAGYDRDVIEHWLNGGNFSRDPARQERLLS